MLQDHVYYLTLYARIAVNLASRLMINIRKQIYSLEHRQESTGEDSAYPDFTTIVSLTPMDNNTRTSYDSESVILPQTFKDHSLC